MKSIRPYIALDLETTGVDVERVHILELGAVLDDGKSEVEGLLTLNKLVKEKAYFYSEPYAMQMNAEILTAIAKTKYGVSLVHVATDLLNMITNCGELAYEWDRANNVTRPSRAVSIAGKNVSTFDYPILLNSLQRIASANPEDHQAIHCAASLKLDRSGAIVKRRFIDIGSMYYDDFGYVPDQGEIMKLIGDTMVTHRALDDSLQVVRAIRYKMK